ncbi:MAG: hypothetical protein IJG00_05160 [Clostridia bacterium]|nr:hypothetical protein [Clostridia bacterium]
MAQEIYKKYENYKIEKNYLYNAKCLIYKKVAEKLEISKEKSHRNINFYG